MRLLINAMSKQIGMDLLEDVCKLIPHVQASMYPISDTHCVSLEFNDNLKYSEVQTAYIRMLQTLGRMQ